MANCNQRFNRSCGGYARKPTEKPSRLPVSSVQSTIKWEQTARQAFFMGLFVGLVDVLECGAVLAVSALFGVALRDSTTPPLIWPTFAPAPTHVDN